MSESQSRYSIIAKLTERKLDILRERAEVAQRDEQLREKILELKSDYDSWKALSESERLRDAADWMQKISAKERQLASQASQRPRVEALCDAQLVAIEEALQRIEDVSGSALPVLTDEPPAEMPPPSP